MEYTLYTTLTRPIYIKPLPKFTILVNDILSANRLFVKLADTLSFKSRLYILNKRIFI